MKKVLIANRLERLCKGQKSFLNRADIAIFTTATNEELLKIHQREKVDLLVTTLDFPGSRIEDIFDIIRKDGELRAVSTIIVWRDRSLHPCALFR